MAQMLVMPSICGHVCSEKYTMKINKLNTHWFSEAPKKRKVHCYIYGGVNQSENPIPRFICPY